MKIEKMKYADLDQVMIIEQASFKIPWQKSYFEYDLKRKGGYLFVAKENNEIIGYVDVWHIADELHLANIAVDIKYRHKGIGSKLLKKIIEMGENSICENILLEVRMSNTIAQKFYEKFGFNKLFIRKKYYPDGEDAIVYEKRFRYRLGFRKNQ